jgi:2-keto-4-pentenoate hydratase
MMKKGIGFFGSLATMGLMTAAILVWAAPPAEVVQKIEDAFVSKTRCPLISQEIKGLTVDQAYEIQAGLVKLREGKGEEVVGYFAGMTNPAAQKAYGMKEPFCGIIFKSMADRPGTLHQKDFVSMGTGIIETEIGFRFGKEITEPIKDLEFLQKAVAGVFPAIHIPEAAFTDNHLIVAADLIASNAGTRKVLIGETAKVDDPNAVKVKLLYNDEEIADGIGKNALGDQWEALKWVVNDVIARGGRVKKDHIIVTGVISKPVSAKLGKYVADYGSFGKIEFEYR